MITGYQKQTHDTSISHQCIDVCQAIAISIFSDLFDIQKFSQRLRRLAAIEMEITMRKAATNNCIVQELRFDRKRPMEGLRYGKHRIFKKNTC